jgi:hypothetical protein
MLRHRGNRPGISKIADVLPICIAYLARDHELVGPGLETILETLLDLHPGATLDTVIGPQSLAIRLAMSICHFKIGEGCTIGVPRSEGDMPRGMIVL